MLPFKNKYLLAPMEGVNDIAFRQLCTEQGAGFTYTPQLNPLALIHEGAKAQGYARTYPGENCGLQLSGRSADTILKAWEPIQKRYALLDLNLGCPSKKIVAQGYGSALLKEKAIVAKLVSDVSSSISKPFTVKMRSGFAKEDEVNIASAIAGAGAEAVTLHARTQAQKYTGKADWELIKRVKQEISIPVVGNGDISAPEHARKHLEHEYCDFVMIGRAAIANPSIFKQCLDYEKKGEYKKTSKENKHELMKEYANLWKAHNLSRTLLRQHLMWMAAGYEGAAKERVAIQSQNNEEILQNISHT